MLASTRRILSRVYQFASSATPRLTRSQNVRSFHSSLSKPARRGLSQPRSLSSTLTDLSPPSGMSRQLSSLVPGRMARLFGIKHAPGARAAAAAALNHPASRLNSNANVNVSVDTGANPHAPPRPEQLLAMPNNSNNSNNSHTSHTSNTSSHTSRMLGKTGNKDSSNNNVFQNAILQSRFFASPSMQDESDGLYEDLTIEDFDGNGLEMSVAEQELRQADDKGNIKKKVGSEVGNDAKVLFDAIFRELVDKYGMQNLRFPKDIMWLAGAPGSGKGDMTKFISDQIGNTNPPITISEILETPESEEFKTRGELVSDRIVLKVLFEKLLQLQYQTGVIVDGFPRTAVQAECIKLLFDKMLFLRRQFENTPHFIHFRRPVFHVTVLYVDERVSVERQLKRGQKAKEHNLRVAQTGVGRMVRIRNTDLSPKLARERYRNFYDNMYASLQIVKEKFPFHFINAETSRQEVKASIVEELQYQSRNELADSTFDNVRRIPLASEIKIDARHQLVRRLDTYERNNKELFNKVIDAIKSEFSPIIKRQALSGQVIIRTENPTFFEELAIDMTLDLLSERGYRVVLDYQRDEIPSKFDVKTGDVTEYKHKRILVFNISFPPPTIRHAVQKSTQWESTLV